MPKRKAEGPPEINVRPEVDDPETSPNHNALPVEQDPASDRVTGEGYPREPTKSHLSPAMTEVDKGSTPGYVSFWDLLSLAGYETW